jgi:hypothetical protein
MDARSTELHRRWLGKEARGRFWNQTAHGLPCESPMVLASQPFSGEIMNDRWKTPESAYSSPSSPGRLQNDVDRGFGNHH